MNEKITVHKIHYAVFSVSPETQTDIYTLLCNNKGDLENIGYAYIGNIKTSKISVNNSNGDSKVLISVDDNDIGSIVT